MLMLLLPLPPKCQNIAQFVDKSLYQKDLQLPNPIKIRSKFMFFVRDL